YHLPGAAGPARREGVPPPCRDSRSRVGDTCYFTCDNTYVQSGPSFKTCLSDGDWTQEKEFTACRARISWFLMRVVLRRYQLIDQTVQPVDLRYARCRLELEGKRTFIFQSNYKFKLGLLPWMGCVSCQCRLVIVCA
ncbi:t-SNARE domain-containing protein 1, partial [Branchiostoma belcheri]